MNKSELARQLGKAFRLGYAFSRGQSYRKGIAEDEGKWITVHPNGKGMTKTGDKAKGQPVLIDGETGEVLGGMGGKFKGKHISAVPKRGKEEQAGAQAKIDRKKAIEKGWKPQEREQLQETTPKEPGKKRDKTFPENLTEEQQRAIYYWKQDAIPTLAYTLNENGALLNRFDYEFPDVELLKLREEYEARNLMKIEDGLRILRGDNEYLNNKLALFEKENGFSLENEPQILKIKEIMAKLKTELETRLNRIKRGTNLTDEQIAKLPSDVNPKTLSKVKRGSAMDSDVAIGEEYAPYTNPHFISKPSFRKNCQTCVVAMEARMRGYDVQAKAKGDVNRLLSYRTNLAWYDTKTGKHPEYIKIDKGVTPETYINSLLSITEDGGRYSIEWAWNERNAHIISMQRENGVLRLQDPQSGKKYSPESFLEYLQYHHARLETTKLIRLNDLAFNKELCDNILTKGRKK